MTINNTNPIELYLDHYDSYHKFQRNHKLGGATAIIFGIALGAIAYYGLSHGMLPQLQNLGMAGNITVAAVGGYAFLSLGLITVLASYILRGNKKREAISEEALLFALSREGSASALENDRALKNRLEKIFRAHDLKRFLCYVDFHYFGRPEIVAGAIHVPIETKTRVLSTLSRLPHFEHIFTELAETDKITPQFQNYFRAGDPPASKMMPVQSVNKYVENYKAEYQNRLTHVLAYSAFPIITTIALGVFGYLGGLPQASFAVNAAYASAGNYVFLTFGAICLMLNYMRTQPKKRQDSDTEALLVALSQPNSWYELYNFLMRPNEHPLRPQNYSAILSYVDQRYFKDETIEVSDEIKGRVIEALLRFNPEEFKITYWTLGAQLSEEMQHFIEKRMFAYIDLKYFPQITRENRVLVRDLNKQAEPLLRALFNISPIYMTTNFQKNDLPLSDRIKTYVNQRLTSN